MQFQKIFMTDPSKLFNDENDCHDGFKGRTLVCEFDVQALTPACNNLCKNFKCCHHSGESFYLLSSCYITHT